MKEITKQDVRKKLDEFLNDQINLEIFHDWLVPLVWEAEELEPEVLYSIGIRK